MTTLEQELASKPVTASKENALIAVEKFKRLTQGESPSTIFVLRFLEAAARRLPKQETIDKDKDRRKKKPVV